jgi:hypothetical protein
MDKETTRKWTLGLWTGATLAWVCIIMFVLVMVATQPGCHAIEGLGRDMEGMSRGIRQADD